MLEEKFCAFIKNAYHRYSQFVADSTIKHYYDKHQAIFPNPDTNEKIFAFLSSEKFRWFKEPEEVPCILLTDRHIYLPHERDGKAIPLSEIAKFRLHDSARTSNGISVTLRDGTTCLIVPSYHSTKYVYTFLSDMLQAYRGGTVEVAIPTKIFLPKRCAVCYKMPAEKYFTYELYGPKNFDLYDTNTNVSVDWNAYANKLSIGAVFMGAPLLGLLLQGLKSGGGNWESTHDRPYLFDINIPHCNKCYESDCGTSESTLHKNSLIWDQEVGRTYIVNEKYKIEVSNNKLGLWFSNEEYASDVMTYNNIDIDGIYAFPTELTQEYSNRFSMSLDDKDVLICYFFEKRLSCLSRIRRDRFLVSTNIPKKKHRNAVENFGKDVAEEGILGVLDLSWAENLAKGLLITPKRVRWNFGKKEYGEIRFDEKFPDSLETLNTNVLSQIKYIYFRFTLMEFFGDVSRIITKL